MGKKEWQSEKWGRGELAGDEAERVRNIIFWCATATQLITSQSNRIISNSHTHQQNTDLTEYRRGRMQNNLLWPTEARLACWKHTVREAETEAGRQRRQKGKKCNILTFFWLGALSVFQEEGKSLYSLSPQGLTLPPSSLLPSLTLSLSHPVIFSTPPPLLWITPASSKFHLVIFILGHFYSSNVYSWPVLRQSDKKPSAELASEGAVGGSESVDTRMHKHVNMHSKKYPNLLEHKSARLYTYACSKPGLPQTHTLNVFYVLITYKRERLVYETLQSLSHRGRFCCLPFLHFFCFLRRKKKNNNNAWPSSVSIVYHVLTDTQHKGGCISYPTPLYLYWCLLRVSVSVCMYVHTDLQLKQPEGQRWCAQWAKDTEKIWLLFILFFFLSQSGLKSCSRNPLLAIGPFFSVSLPCAFLNQSREPGTGSQPHPVWSQMLNS